MKIRSNDIIVDALDNCSLCKKERCPVKTSLKDFVGLEMIVSHCPMAENKHGQ